MAGRSTRKRKPKELIIPLANGGTLCCGPGSEYQWGGYLRICDEKGRELRYWDVQEWETDGEGESVIGAVMNAATASLGELKHGYKLRDGVWVATRKPNPEKSS